MAEIKQFTFNDGGKLTAQFEGEKDGEALFSADKNESLDRELSVTFVDKSGTIKVEKQVTQEGMRIEFDGSDMLFRDCNGDIFAAVKDKFADLVTTKAKAN